MPQKYVWTPESISQLHSLRSDGLSQVNCAKIIGCSDSVVFKMLHPEKKPKPKPKLKSIAPPQMPPRVFHHVASCPIRRAISPALFNAPQLTKSQMYCDLERAVRNTVRLAQH
jgi:hypothetical protein